MDDNQRLLLFGAGALALLAWPEKKKKKASGRVKNPRMFGVLDNMDRRLSGRRMVSNPIAGAWAANPKYGAYKGFHGIDLSTSNEALGPMLSFNLPAGRPWEMPYGYCPGASDFCRAYCYASEGMIALPRNQEIYANNLGMTQRSDFADRMISAIMEAYAKEASLKKGASMARSKTFRIHVSGDFHSTRYVLDWVKIVQSLPDWRFYGYTRCWRNQAEKYSPGMHRVLQVLKRLPNMHLMASTDENTGAPPPGWKQAYIAPPDILKGEFGNYRGPMGGKICRKTRGDKSRWHSGTIQCLECKLCSHADVDITLIMHGTLGGRMRQRLGEKEQQRTVVSWRNPNGKTLVARWETRGGKYWYELYKDRLGYTYSGKGSGGNLGDVSEAEAIAHIENYVDGARRIDGINMKRVKNPLDIATMGSGLATGLGLGTGFAGVKFALGKLGAKTEGNPVILCRCCGKPVYNSDGYPIHTKCIKPHWTKHVYGINASRCKEFKNKKPRGTRLYLNPINQREAIMEAGRRAGRARRNRDESLAKFETDWARKASKYDSDPNEAMRLFRQAYKEESGSYRR